MERGRATNKVEMTAICVVQEQGIRLVSLELVLRYLVSLDDVSVTTLSSDTRYGRLEVPLYTEF